ncbi:MAG: threonine-phosphate decarboxylase [Deltaproteobacteria bacterium]|nr:threonine-phosphate decarboxylase [Deltaproteobacteria bacterium]
MIQGHGGNIYDVARRLGCKPFEIIDMSSNVNPIGPPPGLKEHLKENIDSITALPEVDANNIAYKFAHRYDIDPECVIPGNGTTQFIYAIPQVLKTKKALILGPTYSDYADACTMHNVDFDYTIAEESHLFRIDIDSLKNIIRGFDTVFICNPNNPTGTLISAQKIKMICLSFPNSNFIIDESYLSFVEDGDKTSMKGSDLSNLIVLNSMSKVFRIPGLRVGFLIASKNIIERFHKYMLPWNVNSLAQAAVSYLMTQKNEIDSFVEQTREFVKSEREKLTKTLESTGQIKVIPSTTVFMLARLPDSLTSDKVCEHLLQNRILVRNCSNFKGLSEQYIRISLKTMDINRIVADKLAVLISDLSN